MNPDKRRLCYDFKAITLLVIPIIITLVKFSGLEFFGDEKIEMFPSYLKIWFLAAGTVAGVLFFLMKYTSFNNTAARITNRRDFPEVFARIERLCNELKMDVPEVGFLDSSIPNAFVYKNNKKPILVMTVPLVEILDAKELETVLAHELTHIKNCDLELRKFSLLVRFALFLNPLVHLTEPFVSRSREYLADETAAWITNAPGKLASALLKVEDYTISYNIKKFPTSVPPDVFFFECHSCTPQIFSRCPSTENRVRRLLLMKSK
ncbi:MAG TPA: M48 family metalloprotease [Candidatus Methanoperedens sp.]